MREDGVPSRFPEQAQALLTYQYDWRSDSRLEAGGCWVRLADPANAVGPDCLPANAGPKPRLFIWGDSHAGRFRPGVDRAYGDVFAISSATRDSCPPTFDYDANTCEAGNRFVLSAIERTKPDVVIMFAVWQKYTARDVVSVASRVVQAGARRVIVLGPPPIWKGTLPNLVYAEWRRQHLLSAPIPRRMTADLDHTAPSLDAQMRSYTWPPGVEYVPLHDMLCNAEGCLTFVENSDTELMTWDYGHMTTAGAALVARRLGLNPREFQSALVE